MTVAASRMLDALTTTTTAAASAAVATNDTDRSHRSTTVGRPIAVALAAEIGPMKRHPDQQDRTCTLSLAHIYAHPPSSHY